ncbi:MAG: sulfotransferase family protein [Ignavibacteria bacterium]|nr:sulfotransferase family protein [Ignavibacteria bacterium]
MYSFAQRSDTLVIDEPLYAHYLFKTNADHPGKDEVIASMEKDGEKVVNDIILGDYRMEVIFMKQMTHHLTELDESFLDKVTNVFLIRDPMQLISSLAQVIPEVTMRATGIKRQFELFNELKTKGLNPVVIDSGEILKNPESALTKLCIALGIPFDKNMLHWKAGPREEDGIWAKYWYENVHNSTGFEKQKTSSRELPEDLIPLYQECLPYYNKLFQFSIKPD